MKQAQRGYGINENEIENLETLSRCLKKRKNV
jgi:hypothetical protein